MYRSRTAVDVHVIVLCDRSLAVGTRYKAIMQLLVLCLFKSPPRVVHVWLSQCYGRENLNLQYRLRRGSLLIPLIAAYLVIAKLVFK